MMGASHPFFNPPFFHILGCSYAALRPLRLDFEKDGQDGGISIE